jgi:arginine decarboxylase
VCRLRVKKELLDGIECMLKKNSLDRWSIDDSVDLYNIRNWSAGYFDISKKGDVVVSLKGHKKQSSISLIKIIRGIKDRGLDMPVLLRIQNILDSQITLLHESFNRAIKKADYQGLFKGVYPIKVNQQQQVLEEVAQFGSRYHHGFEAGSKAELIAALSQMKDLQSCLVLNGYKDEEFIDLGLYARKIGFQCFFVIESPGELSVILERAESLQIRPLIGVRAKLSSKAGGHWTESGGDRSIFGLNSAQIVDVVDRLKEKEMLDCLQSGISVPPLWRRAACIPNWSARGRPWAISISAAAWRWTTTAPTATTPTAATTLLTNTAPTLSKRS